MLVNTIEGDGWNRGKSVQSKHRTAYYSLLAACILASCIINSRWSRLHVQRPTRGGQLDSYSDWHAQSEASGGVACFAGDRTHIASTTTSTTHMAAHLYTSLKQDLVYDGLQPPVLHVTSW